MLKKTKHTSLETNSPTLSRDDVDIKKTSRVWDGFFKLDTYTLKHTLFDGGISGDVSRELFEKGDGAAAIVYDPNLKAIGLVEQFRVGALNSPFGPWCMEVVAGMVEQGETPADVILRELQEEAGITDAKLIPITSYYSTPGGCSETIHLFCALCDLNNKEGIYGLESESEDIYFHVLPAKDVFDNMYHSKVNNAATLLGLQWLQAHYEQLS